jgi:hypothetical protein
MSTAIVVSSKKSDPKSLDFYVWFFNRAVVETIIEAARGELLEFLGFVRTVENKSHG